MRVTIQKTFGTWRDVADAARTTVGMEPGEGEPSSRWKTRMLLSEHSPIRLLQVMATFEDLKSWISVHFVRHKIGVEHFVKTQRTDRTGIDRDNLPQSALVNHKMAMDAQAIINISRKRLCGKAHGQTRQAWLQMLLQLEKVHPEIAAVCVPECVYRGWCYELDPCGYCETPSYKATLNQYRAQTKMAELKTKREEECKTANLLTWDAS